MSDEAMQSTSVGALGKALAAAQAKLEDATKDGKNPAFQNSRYASLPSVRDALRKVLPDHGLAVVQAFEPSGPDGVTVVTTLIHESGEWIRSRLYLPCTKKDAQGFGSAITYARRYSLGAIVGIATDDDDDGNGASTKPTTATNARPAAPAKNDPVAAAALDKRVAGYVERIDGAEDLGTLMAVWSEATAAGNRLPAASESYLKGLLSAKRKQLEVKAA